MSCAYAFSLDLARHPIHSFCGHHFCRIRPQRILDTSGAGYAGRRERPNRSDGQRAGLVIDILRPSVHSYHRPVWVDETEQKSGAKAPVSCGHDRGSLHRHTGYASHAVLAGSIPDSFKLCAPGVLQSILMDVPCHRIYRCMCHASVNKYDSFRMRLGQGGVPKRVWNFWLSIFPVFPWQEKNYTTTRKGGYAWFQRSQLVLCVFLAYKIWKSLKKSKKNVRSMYTILTNSNFFNSLVLFTHKLNEPWIL